MILFKIVNFFAGRGAKGGKNWRIRLFLFFILFFQNLVMISKFRFYIIILYKDIYSNNKSYAKLYIMNTEPATLYKYGLL